MQINIMNDQNLLSEQEEKQLSEDRFLLELVNHRAWGEILKPWLEARRSQSYPDPSEFKTEKDFYHAAVTASMFKKVIAELLHYLEIEVPGRIKALEDKKKNKQPDFGIGRG